MAYDASNNQQDQNQVVSSTPLSGGQQPAAQPQPQDSQPAQAPSQPSTVQAGMSSTQAGAAQQPTQQKSASSGMFTNIQKYVQKNKPQAQKMASAVTQNVGSQASEIAQQAKDKEAQMQQSLQANQQAMQQQQQEAAAIAGQTSGMNYNQQTGMWESDGRQFDTSQGDSGKWVDIQQPAQPEVTPEMAQQPEQQPTAGGIAGINKDPFSQNYDNWVQSTLGDKYDSYQEELNAIQNRQIPMDHGPGSANEQAGQQIQADIEALNERYGVGRDTYGQQRYQELMQGPAGISQVGNLNIAQQNQKARALQQLAGTANTEMGRRGLLQDTFRQGDQEYTQGMGSLDQLITSGDEQAREALVTGVQEQAQGLQDQLQQVGSDANKAKMAQDMAMQQFGTDISQLGADAQAAIIGQVDEQVAAEKAALNEQMDAMKEAAMGQFNQKYADETEFYKAIMGQFAPEWSKAGNRDWQDYMSMQHNLLGSGDGGFLKAIQDRGIGGYTYDGFNRQAFEGDKADFLNKNITLGSQGAQKLQSAFEGLLENAADFGLDPNIYRKQLQDLGKAGKRSDIYGWSGHQKNRVGDIYSYDVGQFKDITKKLFADMQAAKDNALAKQLEHKYGLGAEGAQDFMSGASIDRAGVATEDQASKMAALRGLLGAETDELGTELGDSAKIGQDTAFFEKLKKGLNLG